MKVSDLMAVLERYSFDAEVRIAYRAGDPMWSTIGGIAVGDTDGSAAQEALDADTGEVVADEPECVYLVAGNEQVDASEVLWAVAR